MKDDLKGAKVNNSSKAPQNKVKKVSKPKVSKAIKEKQSKAEAFKIAEASSYDKLLQASRLTILDSMSLSKAFKHYLVSAKKVLTPKQMKVLTFKAITEHLKGSKYGSLDLFSVHQVALVCNEILKKNDLNTARALKVARQNKAIAKK
jgi:hypothetical protein